MSMKPSLSLIVAAAVVFGFGSPRTQAEGGAALAQPRMLPGVLSAEDLLNGAYPFPPSPPVEVGEMTAGFDATRLTPVPAPGMHPRILISPGDLPELRRRLQDTQTGRALHANLLRRLHSAIGDPASWSHDLYERLAQGDSAGARALVSEHHGWPGDIGHYQPWLSAIVLESLDALITEDGARGRAAATALTTYVDIISPDVLASLEAPLGDDVFRARAAGPSTGPTNARVEVRNSMGYQFVGYGYDFAYPYMTPAQRDRVRSLISSFTRGHVWMGAELPHHFRNWNWIAIGLQVPVLSLAIEGEAGYDPRVYRLGVQIARDYLAYGISPQGVSTEAVGYTQFGLTWANPFIVAAARRGDNLLVQSHFRSMIDWYLQSMDPGGLHWTSHGDGGDTGPSISTLLMWRTFLPLDPKVDFLWQCYLRAGGDKALNDTFALVEPLLWARDGLSDPHGRPVDYAGGASLGLPLSLFDPTRSSLMARSSWGADATAIEFECRTDSVGSSHEHADRGSFTLAALGRSWAKDNFRSVETKFHNLVLVDGKGQGFWPGPGRWLGLSSTPGSLTAACDAKDCYDWSWPKEILTENPRSFVRFGFPRWESFAGDAAALQESLKDLPLTRDPRPSVVRHWEGFTAGDPRMWDEDGWPVRAPWNPLRRAFRTISFLSQGKHPCLLVVDDIQKDDQVHLYEWLMQTGLNTELASRHGDDLILCDADVPRDEEGNPRPPRGARELLVRILDLSHDSVARNYTATPESRLETIERKDTLVPEMKAGALSGSRSYGLDKRLVIATRSVAPDFKILLYPMRAGEGLPTTRWNDDHTLLTLTRDGADDTLRFTRDPSARTIVTVNP